MASFITKKRKYKRTTFHADGTSTTELFPAPVPKRLRKSEKVLPSSGDPPEEAVVVEPDVCKDPVHTDDIIPKGRIHVNRLKRATARVEGLSEDLPPIDETSASENAPPSASENAPSGEELPPGQESSPLDKLSAGNSEAPNDAAGNKFYEIEKIVGRNAACQQYVRDAGSRIPILKARKQ